MTRKQFITISSTLVIFIIVAFLVAFELYKNSSSVIINDKTPTLKNTLPVTINGVNSTLNINSPNMRTALYEEIKPILMKNYCIFKGESEEKVKKEIEKRLEKNKELSITQVENEVYKEKFREIVLDSIEVSNEEIEEVKDKPKYWIFIEEKDSDDTFKIKDPTFQYVKNKKFSVSEKTLVSEYNSLAIGKSIELDNAKITNLKLLNEKEVREKTILKLKESKIISKSESILVDEFQKSNINFNGVHLDTETNL